MCWSAEVSTVFGILDVATIGVLCFRDRKRDHYYALAAAPIAGQELYTGDRYWQRASLRRHSHSRHFFVPASDLGGDRSVRYRTGNSNSAPDSATA
jgi:hypothetical protein